MRKIEKINKHHSPSAIRAAANEAVADAVRLHESNGDEADRLEFGPKGSGLATVLYIKHSDGDVSNRELRGNRGRRGRLGAPGSPGVMGREGRVGPQGDQGDNGDQGVEGPVGLEGRQGEVGPRGIPGPAGPIGPTGERGPVPRHQWDGTRLAFELPNGKLGRSVELQGPGGGRGARGATGTTAFIQERIDRERSMSFFLGT